MFLGRVRDWGVGWKMVLERQSSVSVRRADKTDVVRVLSGGFGRYRITGYLIPPGLLDAPLILDICRRIGRTIVIEGLGKPSPIKTNELTEKFQMGGGLFPI